ncbi:MAG: hypothetical protein Q7U75_04605, partial [Desulfobacterales bacterium]|nr:hypothetical protein [Desulfobacterales bacterium]
MEVNLLAMGHGVLRSLQRLALEEYGALFKRRGVLVEHLRQGDQQKSRVPPGPKSQGFMAVP